MVRHRGVVPITSQKLSRIPAYIRSDPKYMPVPLEIMTWEFRMLEVTSTLNTLRTVISPVVTTNAGGSMLQKDIVGLKKYSKAKVTRAIDLELKTDESSAFRVKSPLEKTPFGSLSYSDLM